MRAIFAAACMLLVSCTADEGATVSRSSDLCGASCKQSVLSHLASQKAKIAASSGLGFCRIAFDGGVPRSGPRPEIVMDLKSKGHSDAANQYAPFVIVNANRWYWNGDVAAGRRAISLMSEWANADALTSSVSDYGNNGRTSSDRWPSYGVLTSTLNSLFLLDDHPDLTDAREQAIWSWIDRTMERGWLFGQLPRGGAGALNDTEQRRNNHNARRALILLYYGIHTDNERLIRKSVADINRSYRSFDAAGVPLDANRGDWALNYVNFALDSMTLHASFMETISPGYLASNPDVVSKLNAGTAFLFDELVNPGRIHSYARENVGRPQDQYSGRQEAWFARDIHFGAELWAWVDSAAAKRLPNGAVAARRALGNRPQWRQAKFNETGGGVTCWFR